MAQVIPVDFVTNSTIAAAWDIQRLQDPFCIYHPTSSTVNPVSIRLISSEFIRFIRIFPSRKAFFRPSMSLVTSERQFHLVRLRKLLAWGAKAVLRGKHPLGMIAENLVKARPSSRPVPSRHVHASRPGCAGPHVTSLHASLSPAAPTRARGQVYYTAGALRGFFMYFASNEWLYDASNVPPAHMRVAERAKPRKKTPLFPKRSSRLPGFWIVIAGDLHGDLAGDHAGVSDLYGVRDAACPISTKGGGHRDRRRPPSCWQVLALHGKMSRRDRALFPVDCRPLQWAPYFEEMCVGLLKAPPCPWSLFL